MNIHFRDKLLTEALRIGDQLLSKVEKSEYGFSWKTMGIGGEDKEVTWNASENIYSGVSGIVLFFIELYKQSKDSNYLEAVKEGTRWVENYCNKNPTNYYAFFTGRMGAAYLMMEVGKFLNDDNYKEKAAEIAKGCEVALYQPYGIDDLINGASGTLLSLLHLHAYTNDDQLLGLIKKYTQRLIDKAHVDPKGLYWDKSSKNIRGLCGFSHGASGIGYVFLELGKYFNNETFYWIAEQAFAYENHFYNEEMGNWPDFRKGYFDQTTLEEHKNEYLKGNKAFFTTPGNMSAWCHGAPGIGLARLKAIELLNKKEYTEDLEKAVKQTYKATVGTENSMMQSYTLCHGGGGNAMLFLEAYRQLGKDEYITHAEEVAQNGLGYIKKYKKYIPGYAKADIEDLSLFMGNAGVGYFYLQLLEPLTTPSVLKPDVSGLSEVTFDYSISDVFNQLINKDFSKTSSLVNDFKFKMNGDIEEILLSGIKSGIERLNDERINAVFNYEMQKSNFRKSFTSDAYLEIQKVVEQEKNYLLIESGDNSLLLSKSFKLNKNVKIGTFDWDFVNTDNVEKEEYNLLNIVETEGVTEHDLSQFSYLILKAFESGKRGEEVLNEMSTMYEISSDEDKDKMEEALIKQIKEALISSVLIQS